MVENASDDTLIKGSHLLERITRKPNKKETVRTVRMAFENNHPTYQLAKRLVRELHPNCKRGLAVNFALRSILYDQGKRQKYERSYGVPPPFTILVSPTMRCNLNCIGCYDGDYPRMSDMSPDLLQEILNEARAIGINFITFLGGEPLLYPHLFDIMEKNEDFAFQVFTNGTLVNELLVKRIIDSGNIAMVISMDGLEEKTTEIRGAGVYQSAMSAMDLLRKAGGLFFFSVRLTRNNWDELTSPGFIDHMIDKGAALGWYFNYMPVGEYPDVSLMPTPEQRNEVRSRITEIRRKKPILLIDFFGDGPLVNGCLAGGKLYVHINNKGDVEPCIFCHFAVDNINNSSLIAALNSSYFRAIRQLQPFCDNDLHPCMLIDHPDLIKKLVDKYNAYPTHSGASSLLNELNPLLHRYSRRTVEILDEVWEKEYRWVEAWRNGDKITRGRFK